MEANLKEAIGRLALMSDVVPDNSIRAIIELLKKHDAKYQRILLALDPNATKGLYIGTVSFDRTVTNPLFDEEDDSDDAEPETIKETLMLPWTEMKAFMTLIRNTAGISTEGGS